MAYTKREFIQEAFAEMGRANYVFDASPEDLQSALRRLDSLLAEWNGRGIRLGYPLPSSPGDSSLSEQTNVPDWANKAIITHLAIELSPSIGKTVSIETKVAAQMAMGSMLNRVSTPIEMQLGSIPAGAGHKSVDYPFLSPSTDTLPLESGGDLTFN